jgi:hypothetical protein
MWSAEPLEEHWTLLERLTRPWILMIIVVAVVAFLVIGFGNWSPRTFSGQFTTSDESCGLEPACGYDDLNLPGGRNIDVRWTDESGGTVAFGIIAPGTGPGSNFACRETGSTGICLFTPFVGNYALNAVDSGSEGNQTVTFTGIYFVSFL